MRVLSAEAYAALDSGRFSLRWLFRVDMPDGPFAVWSDLYSITVGGTVYTGIGNVFAVPPSASVADMAARNIDVPFSGLDQLLASRVEAEPWHQRPASLQLAIISVDNPQIVSIKPWFVGFLDQLVRRDKPNGTADLTCRCESIARELSRKGARTRSDSDQRQRDPNDGFFKHTVGAVSTHIDWGKLPTPPPPKKPKFLGIF
jgi:hypothetical protein